jgi:hypothetical protein
MTIKQKPEIFEDLIEYATSFVFICWRSLGRSLKGTPTIFMEVFNGFSSFSPGKYREISLN